ncbi:SDR family NAD(P)-dependent oxidoreductase [Plantactinospora sp. GCM10030261]|uniref:SDR family NAD(P)-dependent oxidoreductase n=1 Tax=Plantactinospora sp. GCM10030261 TaxID=3273420 RepID=UPI00360A9005
MDGTVALVTGGSSGIGAAIARRLAAGGARLYVTGRDTRRLAEVAGHLGGTPLPAELTDPAEVRGLADQVLADAGRVDVLVHSAGLGWAGRFADMPPDRVIDLVALDLIAPMLLTRAVLPGMRQRRRGHIGFVGSIAGRLAVGQEAVYSAAKGGLGIFADSLRQEVRGCGIIVTELVPAVVDTPFFARRGRPYHRTVPRPVPPDRAAATLLDAMFAGRDEAYLPRWMRLPVAVRALAPSTYRRLSTRFG